MRTFLLVFLFTSFASLYAQDSLFRSDVYRFADATVYTYSQPIRWKQNDWLALGGVVAGTVALTLIDEPIRALFTRTEEYFPMVIEDVGYHYGKPYSAFTITGGFYVIGLILNDRWTKDTGLNLGATLLTSGLLQTMMKDVVGRARPDTDAGPYRFKIPSKGDIGYHSFPSGHSSVAFGITFVLARRINSKPIKILLYTLAASTALSRLHTDAHWFSDIAFGAALAWFCDETISERMNFTSRASKGRLRKISWRFAPGSQGLSLIGKL